ncbi:MAG: Fic family protein [Propionibacteriaceae bacterium]|nr:Fic family protein [Propionibacteriaceae bacterium]
MLEGAATTRQVANEMLRSRRPPRTPGERMIANNFAAMQWIREHAAFPVTPDRVRDLHQILTADMLADDESGRLQLADDERVVVSTPDGMVLHSPPPAEQLEERLDTLCRFANGDIGPSEWLHPIARAIITHFMFGYDHYFVDGNGRTARALFYWVALREGHWLMEYLSLSRLLTLAPAQYGKAYLDVETDDGDVTYFIIHQLGVLWRALEHLDDYLDRKQQQLSLTADVTRGLGLNHRQQAVIARAVQDPGVVITAASHASSHGVTVQTARADLSALAKMGLLRTGKQSRSVVWTPAPQLPNRMEELNEL